MKFIIAKKLEMSQRFKEDGPVVPVTLLTAEPCQVTQVKNVDQDGYEAVQIGTEPDKHPNKPEAGHTKAAGQAFSVLKEFRVPSGAFKPGDVIDVGQFEPGDYVQVIGTSKGKGFQGVVNRHHFAGGPASHGHKDNLRMPGSIGAGGHQHVHLGQRMGGHMGDAQITVKNLEIVMVKPEANELWIKGA